MRAFNHEIRKYRGHTIDGTHIGYLSGLEFNHFLHLWIQPRAGVPGFFFIQVCAHNGVSNDHLYALTMKYKLRGILVEPQVLEFSMLERNYSQCDTVILENVAIADEEGEKTLYTIKPELHFLRYANQIASLNFNHTKQLLAHHLKREATSEVVRQFNNEKLTVDACISTLIVKSTTFRSLLVKHGVSKYDLLQVDAEGFDYEVLKAANVEKYRPALINYEHEHLSECDRDDCWKFLIRIGYHLFTHSMGDTTAYLLD